MISAAQLSDPAVRAVVQAVNVGDEAAFAGGGRDRDGVPGALPAPAQGVGVSAGAGR
jgi:hypothetical protein